MCNMPKIKPKLLRKPCLRPIEKKSLQGPIKDPINLTFQMISKKVFSSSW